MITRVARLPVELYIEVTNRCNSRCQTCVRTFEMLEPLRDLTLDEFRGLVDQVPELQRAVLHGVGEPLLNQELPAMVAYLKKRAESPQVLFNSNAILLTAGMQEDLVWAELDEFRVSIDAAHAELYARIRGVDTFDQVVDRVGAFARRVRESGEGPRLSLWFTAMHENLSELPELVRLAHRLAVYEVYVQRLVYFGQGLARQEQSAYRSLKATEDAAVEEAEVLAAQLGVSFRASGATSPRQSLVTGDGVELPWSKCSRTSTLAYITANGNVLPCCFSPFTTRDYGGLVLGNAFHQPLFDIWNGGAYRGFRAAQQTASPPEACDRCGVCWSL